MKASKLSGTALDWAVAKCEGKTYTGKGQLNDFRASRLKDRNTYSVSWAQGGSIIERENLSVSYWGDKSKFGQHSKPEQWWEARHPTHRTHSRRTVGYGPTPLIAAMRCYVASKLGEEVEIPEELK